MADYRTPQGAYTFLATAIKRQNENEPAGVLPLLPITGLIEIINTETYTKNKATGLRIWVRAVRGDGRADILEYFEEAHHAVQDEPGYTESMVRWRNLDDEGRPIEWVFFYTAEMLSMGSAVRIFEQERAKQRHQKLKYLYYAITPQIRARIDGGTLEVNKAQYREATQLLGRILMGFDARDDLWTKMPKPVEEISTRFPGPEHS